MDREQIKIEILYRWIMVCEYGASWIIICFSSSGLSWLKLRFQNKNFIDPCIMPGPSATLATKLCELRKVTTLSLSCRVRDRLDLLWRHNSSLDHVWVQHRRNVSRRNIWLSESRKCWPFKTRSFLIREVFKLFDCNNGCMKPLYAELYQESIGMLLTYAVFRQFSWSIQLASFSIKSILWVHCEN